MITFTVPGVPSAQGSKRHVGRGIMVETNKQLKPWRASIAALAPRPSELLAGPLAVTLTFSWSRPKKHYRTGRNEHLLREDAPRWHAQTPDIDKCARAVLDALTGVVWRDDSQVAQLTLIKLWAEHTPGVDIRIGQLDSGLVRP